MKDFSEFSTSVTVGVTLMKEILELKTQAVQKLEKPT